MKFPGYDEEWDVRVEGNVLHLNLGPFLVWGGSEDYVFQQSRPFSLPDLQPDYGYLFTGLDRGDIVELGFEVHDGRGIPLAKPISLHKEAAGNFDAYQRIDFDRPKQSTILNLVTVCRTTGENRCLPDHEFTTGIRKGLTRLTSRPHFGLWLYLK